MDGRNDGQTDKVIRTIRLNRLKPVLRGAIGAQRADFITDGRTDVLMRAGPTDRCDGTVGCEEV